MQKLEQTTIDLPLWGKIVYFYYPFSPKIIKALIPKEFDFNAEVDNIKNNLNDEFKEQKSWIFDDGIKHIEKTIPPASEFNLQIHIGDLCNFECGYCCVEHWKKTNDKTSLSDDHILNITTFLDSYANKNVSSFVVLLTGGEPTLPIYHNKVMKIIDILYDYVVLKLGKKIFFEINTNGYNIKSFIQKIKKKEEKYGNIFTYRITLDGLRKTHDGRRNLRKLNIPTFDKIVENIQLILDSTIGSLLIRSNIDKTVIKELSRLWLFLHEKDILIDKNVNRINIENSLLVIPDKKNNPSLWSSEKYQFWKNLHIPQTIDSIIEINSLWIEFIYHHLPSYLIVLGQKFNQRMFLPFQLRACEIGDNLFAMILPNGDFSFCNELEFVDPPKFGNLSDCKYDEELLKLLRRTVKDMTMCQNCKDVFTCAGLCPLLPLYYFRNAFLPSCGKVTDKDYAPIHHKIVDRFLEMNPSIKEFMKTISEESLAKTPENFIVNSIKRLFLLDALGTVVQYLINMSPSDNTNSPTFKKQEKQLL